ncbi:MAG: hypothetical protein O2945_12400 [Planctomycetota bacterium]|nr:hypothetical protein [Planctomycetota bacterium]
MGKLAGRLFFVEWEKDAETTMHQTSWTIDDTSIPMAVIKTDSFSPIFGALSKLKRKLSAGHVKQIQGMVYDIVKKNNGNDRVYVVDEDSPEAVTAESELVFGFGLKERIARVGIKGLSMIDLLMDAINDRSYDADAIVSDLLPALPGKYIPYFKHLDEAKFLLRSGDLSSPARESLAEALIRKIDSIDRTTFFPGGSYDAWQERVNDEYKSIKDILAADGETLNHRFIYVLLLNDRNIRLTDLAMFLRKYDNTENLENTLFRKVVCLYDFLKYRKRKSN